MPSYDDLVRAWSRDHDGYDVSRSRVVRAWLHLVHAVAAPLARRRVPPDAVTLAGVACAALATVVPAGPAGALVVVTAVLDGIDGAVARRGAAANRHGFVIDHLADRITDVLFAVALRRAGARCGSAVAAGATTVGFELGRDVLRIAHRRPRSVVTIGERPTRVAATVIGLRTSPTAGAAAVCGLAVVSAVQLIRRVR